MGAGSLEVPHQQEWHVWLHLLRADGGPVVKSHMTSCGRGLREGGISGWITADRAEKSFLSNHTWPCSSSSFVLPRGSPRDSGAASPVLKQGTQCDPWRQVLSS